MREQTGGQIAYISTLGDVTQGEADHWRLELYANLVDDLQRRGALIPSQALELKDRAIAEMNALFAGGLEERPMDEVEAVTLALYRALVKAQEGTK